MTTMQKVIKYLAIALAIVLCVGIIAGICGAFSAISMLFDRSDAAGQTEVFPVSGEVRELKIELGAARLSVQTGVEFRVESNVSKLNVKQKNGVLEITQSSGHMVSNTELFVTLYLPADASFDRVDLETGAGTVDIERLSAARLEMELGAGKTTVDELIATASAEIDTGAGSLSIRQAQLRNLSLDVGVGELKLTGRLEGSSSINSGVGATTLTLLGSADEYTIELDKGLGEVTLDGKKLSDGAVCGSGENRIEIDCGVGAMKISFQADPA